MTNQTLRTLAKDYANGTLNKEAYRKSRDELLAGVLSGDIPLPVNEYRPPLRAQDLDSTFEKPSIEPVPPQQDMEPITEFVTPPSKRGPPIIAGKSRPGSPLKHDIALIAVVTIFFIAVLIVVMSVLEEDGQPTNRDNITDSDPGQTPPALQNQSATELMEEFLQRRNWSNESLQQFTAQWNNLIPDDQASGLASPLSIQLTNAIYKQLLEDRALFGTGDDDAIMARQHALVDFAKGIGIDDPRLKVREAEPATITPPDTLPVPAYDSMEDIDSSGIEKDMQESAVFPEIINIENENACVPSLVKQRVPYCRDTLDGTNRGPALTVISAGKFMMGGDKPNEQPKHAVEITYPFAVSVNEISQEDFELFCVDAQRPCPLQPWSNKNYPVVNITWHDADAYAGWLSNKTGNQYRLPTEAEWEYAARANTTTRYPFGDEISITDAVFSGIKPLTAPLPRSDHSKIRNNFRLYHMTGNVREWVMDAWRDNYNNASSDGSAYIDSNSNYHVIRGGSYADNADALRSSAREKLSANTADIYTVFRVVLELG